MARKDPAWTNIPLACQITARRDTTRNDRLRLEEKRKEEEERLRKRRREEEAVARILAAKWAEEDRRRKTARRKDEDEGSASSADWRRRRRRRQEHDSEDARSVVDEGPSANGHGTEPGERIERSDPNEPNEPDELAGKAREEEIVAGQWVEVERRDVDAADAGGSAHGREEGPSGGSAHGREERPSDEGRRRQSEELAAAFEDRRAEASAARVKAGGPQRGITQSKIAGVFGFSDSDSEREKSRREIGRVERGKTAVKTNLRPKTQPRPPDGLTRASSSAATSSTIDVQMRLAQWKQSCKRKWVPMPEDLKREVLKAMGNSN
mmetsp:Transcript_58862/g.164411  ORF Transcript_58862/g.164411 Transcript_58862/m.164411 type:complete len:323 (-) Transcript_58862:109-1077(-)